MPVAVVRTTPGRLPGLLVGRAKASPKAIIRGLKAGARRGRSKVVRATPVDRGLAKNAWKVRATDRLVELFNEAPYIGVLEEGARPHAVSKEGQEAIRLWIVRNIPLVTISRGPRKGEKRTLNSRDQKTLVPTKDGWAGKYDAAVEAILERILWKLRKKGQKGRRFVRALMGELALLATKELVRHLHSHLSSPSGGGSGATP